MHFFRSKFVFESSKPRKKQDKLAQTKEDHYRQKLEVTNNHRCSFFQDFKVDLTVLASTCFQDWYYDRQDWLFYRQSLLRSISSFFLVETW